ncbi:hypothetical protein BJX70DRAFT_367427, partial [Aspergillus crustosus]
MSDSGLGCLSLSLSCSSALIPIVRIASHLIAGGLVVIWSDGLIAAPIYGDTVYGRTTRRRVSRL